MASSPIESGESSSLIESRESGTPLESGESSSPIESGESGPLLESRESGTPLESRESRTPIASKELSTPIESKEPSTPLESKESGFNHQAKKVVDFIHLTHLGDIPDAVQQHARYLLLDLVGVAAVGRQTQTADIITNFANSSLAAGQGCPSAPILFDGRVVSPAGAALAGGMMIDSVDAHDGYKAAKGHVGCALLPALLAGLGAVGRLDDQTELLTSLIIGYEIGTRCGLALHASVSDYHTSGAWMAVASAGLVSRLYQLDHQTSWQAMGIAEYHGPRSQMMRVIDHSTMLKDGSGWGAMVGVSAAGLAKEGFTGAPAITISDPAVGDIWADLGTRWMILEQYMKLWPVCRWAQPAMQAVHKICSEHKFALDDITKIKIETFHHALRLASPHPTTPDEAQYSLCWPVAAALMANNENRQFGSYDISNAALARADIHAISDKIRVIEDPAFNAIFPEQRQSRLSIELRGGDVLSAHTPHTKGDPESPLSRAEITSKFDAFLAETPRHSQAELLKEACLSLAKPSSAPPLCDLLFCR